MITLAKARKAFARVNAGDCQRVCGDWLGAKFREKSVRKGLRFGESCARVCGVTINYYKT